MKPVYGWKVVMLALLMSFSSIFSGCATVPSQEMANARQAIQLARQAGAERYASGELQDAEILLEQAKEALDRKAFSEAREHARAAIKSAQDAKSIALLKREQPQ